MGVVIHPFGAASAMLTGVKNIGRFLSKKAAEKAVKKVFTKKILNVLIKGVIMILAIILSITINVCIGTICNFIIGCVWMLSSIGNFIGGIMHILEYALIR